MDDQRIDGAQAPVPAAVTEEPAQSFIERHKIPPVLFAAGCLAAVFVTYQIVGGLFSLFLFGQNPSVDSVTGLRIITGLGQILLVLLPALFLTRLATRTPVPFLQLRLPDYRTLLVPLVGIISLQQMLQVYIIFQDRIPMPPELQGILDQLKQAIEQLTKLLVTSNSGAELVTVIAIIAVIPAVVEELFFRGLIQRCFELQIGARNAIILGGIIFAGFHLNPFEFVPLAVLGIYLGFLRTYGRSLWVSVAAHFYNNLYACVMVFWNMDNGVIGSKNPEQLSTGPLLIIFWLFGILFLVSTLYFINITKSLRMPPAVDPGAAPLT
jgi:membrane protease YdiL (CAAX protease family)